MNGRTGWTLYWVGLLILYVSTVFAQERWVYRHNGPGNGADQAFSVAVGPDGNLHAAGRTYVGGIGTDFTVVSLSASGGERWIYRYGGPANDWDEARSIAVGTDGNLYVAGYCCVSGSNHDFTVVSLTDSGTERWMYQYDGPESGNDEAHSIVIGSDGNVYAAGYSSGTGTHSDLTVVSLTDSGGERWIYRYNGPADTSDAAHSVIVGSDGNLYIAGESHGSGTSSDLTVVSLTDSGVERWVYRYNGPGNDYDGAFSILMGSDGYLYAAGASEGDWSFNDFTVVSLTASGEERWVYGYNGPGNYNDRAFSILMGSDGHLYAAGRTYSSVTQHDFAVVSLNALGEERWVYRYIASTNQWDQAFSIVMDLDGNLYAAGECFESGSGPDFTVVSLTDSGVERWVYQYEGLPSSYYDCAFSITLGSDGNLCAAGLTTGSGTYDDFTVVSLAPEVGVANGPNRSHGNPFRLWQNSPNPLDRTTVVSYSLPSATQVTLAIYDITGRLVETLVNETQQPGIHQVLWNRKDYPSGVYFYRLTAGESVRTKKMVVVE